MPKAKRVRGERLAPNLPKLKASDYKPDLWEGVNKGGWTIEEAAYYVNEQTPAGKINPAASSKVSQIYLWLSKEYDEGRLYSGMLHEGNHLFSPGVIIRYLWEQDRYVSLKVWALYDAADRGEIAPGLQIEMSAENYKKAANIIWDEYRDATKNDVIKILKSLPSVVKGSKGLPLFFPMSESYMENLLKGCSKRTKGRPKKGSTTSLEEHKDRLIKLIQEKMGR